MAGEENMFGGLNLDNLGQSQEDTGMVEVNTENTTKTKNVGSENQEITGGQPETEKTEENKDSLIEVNTEKTETKEEETTKKDNQEEAGSGSSSKEDKADGQPTPYKAFAAVLREEGVLPDFDPEKEEFSSYQEIFERIKENQHKAIEEGVNKYKENIDPKFREVLEGTEKGASFQELVNIKAQEEALENIAEEDIAEEDNEELRKSLIFNHYRATTKFSDDKINKLVKNTIDNGEDVEEAKEALTSLKTLQKEQKDNLVKQAEKERTERQKANKQQVDALQNMLKKKTSFFPGQEKVDDKFKDTVFDHLTKVIDKTEDGQPLTALTKKRAENPMEFDMMTAALVAAGVYDGKWDKVLGGKEKDVYNKFEEALKDKTNKSGKSPSTNNGNSDSKEILEALQGIGI